MLLYHLTDNQSWERTLQKGCYAPAPNNSFCYDKAHIIDAPLAIETMPGQTIYLLHLSDKKIKSQLSFELEEARFRLSDKIPLESIIDVGVMEVLPDGTINWEESYIR